MSDKHLIVYKASAGSGKTYTLVYEYIKYLFIEQSDYITNAVWKENIHRKILAVTFTNKSTIEMKERIVKSLHEMAGNSHPEYNKRLKEDVPALDTIDDDIKKDAVISDTAARLMSDILQDYSLFRVQTIDAFFQQIIRSFANELNLNSNYTVELDSDAILERAVDNMLASLSVKDSDAANSILGWLTEFTKDRIENKNGWNPRSGLIKLSKLLTSESYILNKKDSDVECSISDLKEYRNNLRNIVKGFRNQVESVCSEARSILTPLGDNPYQFFKANTLSPFSWDYLVKKKFEFTNTFLKAVEDVAWLKNGADIDSNIINSITACANRLVDLCQGDERRLYTTAGAIQKNIYILGILTEIQKNVSEICRENDCMIISSTSDFINQVIDGADTPFIYEKIGVSTSHFMIDEFQDTSRMQWNNFIPLLEESLGRADESLLVGDVKQSIYRWRNGDWKILHEDVNGKFGSRVKDKNLDYNYRSEKNIIDFNNYLYSKLPEAIDLRLNDQINKDVKIKLAEIYQNSAQKTLKTDGKGYVRCKFFRKADCEDSFTDSSLNEVVEVLKRRENYSNTAVLVRTNAEAEAVAQRLNEENIPFFSNNALNVASDGAVRFIIATVRYVIQYDEPLVFAEFMSLYNEVILNRTSDDADFGSMAHVMEQNTAFFETNGIADKIPDFLSLKQMPLLRMVQSIAVLFNLESISGSRHSAYIRAFIDKVQEYCNTYTADIPDFLRYWTQYGSNVFIPMPENDNAIEIMTIFKSKGLEFNTVFVPFFDWDIAIRSGFENIRMLNVEDLVISHPNIETVPVNIAKGKELLYSYFSEDILDEFQNCSLDVLNVMYVATTRPKTELYINALLQEPSVKKESAQTQKIEKINLPYLTRQILMSADGVGTYDEEQNLYEYGKEPYIRPLESSKLQTEEQLFEIKPYPVASFSENEERMTLHFHKSDRFTDNYEAINKGIMMHSLFERIETLSDVDDAINALVESGAIVPEQESALRNFVSSIFENETVATWFSGKYTSLNEMEIFDVRKNKVCRPDRILFNPDDNSIIVIDYKFGEKTPVLHKKYERQVAEYMNIIKGMGYRSIKGYILYAKDLSISEITLNHDN